MFNKINVYLMALLSFFSLTQCKSMNEETKKTKHWGYGWYSEIAKGNLYFYYGTMGAGKSALAIKKIKEFSEKGSKTYVYIPSQIGEKQISSRNGQSFEAQCLNLNEVKENSILIIDEAQFLSESEILLINDLLKKDTTILCFGLLTTFQKKLFDGSKHLLEIASVVREIPMDCEKCKKKKAVYNFRTSCDTSLISLGKNQYIALCEECLRIKERAKFLAPYA